MTHLISVGLSHVWWSWWMVIHINRIHSKLYCVLLTFVSPFDNISLDTVLGDRDIVVEVASSRRFAYILDSLYCLKMLAMLISPFCDWIRCDRLVRWVTRGRTGKGAVSWDHGRHFTSYLQVSSGRSKIPPPERRVRPSTGRMRDTRMTFW